MNTSQMAQQRREEGWPLGLLHPLNATVIGLSSSSSFSSSAASNGSHGGGGGGGGGSVSFNTLLSLSPDSSSSDSSSDLDSQTTTGSSFFHERITTFERFIGASSTLDLSKRTTNTRNAGKVDTFKLQSKPKLWFFSVWCRSSSDVEVVDSAAAAATATAPLSHFLAAERRRRRRSSNGVIGPYYDGVGLLCQSTPESNSLFVDGRIAPPRDATPWLTSGGGQAAGNSPVLQSWICGPK